MANTNFTPNSFTAKPPDAFAERHPELLRQLREVLAKYPVKAAYLFGSYARGDERPDSDVDIYVQVDYEEGRFGLMQLSALMLELEARSGKKVDVGTQMDERLYRFAADDLTLIYSAS